MTITEDFKTITEDLRKPLESKPFYAMAGALDVTVEQVRKVGTMERPNLVTFKITPTEVRKDITEALSTVSTELTHLPQRAQTMTHDLTIRVEETYDELVVRGRRVVTRVRRQSATQHLTEEARTTVRRTRAAASTAKASGTATKRAARKTTGTVRSGAAATAKATKAAAQSAAATVEQAAVATEKASEKLGN